uniref:SFRICE_028668 n=1 Tax=Spodoptera frugiperda TaxID=7108 RepID=A0A2H1WUJ9_SPOFR
MNYANKPSCVNTESYNKDYFCVKAADPNVNFIQYLAVDASRRSVLLLTNFQRTAKGQVIHKQPDSGIESETPCPAVALAATRLMIRHKSSSSSSLRRCECGAARRGRGRAARGRGSWRRGGGGAGAGRGGAPLAQHDDAAVAVGGARHLLVAVAGRTADGRHKHSTGGDGSSLRRFLSIINLEYEGNTRGGHVARPPASPASPPAANTQAPELQAAHYCGEWGPRPVATDPAEITTGIS